MPYCHIYLTFTFSGYDRRGNLPFLPFIEETFQYYVNQWGDEPQYMVCFERCNTRFCGIVVYHNYADFCNIEKISSIIGEKTSHDGGRSFYWDSVSLSRRQGLYWDCISATFAVALLRLCLNTWIISWYQTISYKTQYLFVHYIVFI